MINARQRFAHFRASRDVARKYRGSMVWMHSKDADYLMRSDYDPATGKRRQRSLGRRTEALEAMKAEFEEGRRRAAERLKSAQASLKSQSAICRVLGLGRVPLASARILRIMDEVGLLGRGLLTLGTNAIYAYEAAAGVMISADLLATGDLDLLYDAKARLNLQLPDDEAERSILALLQRTDRSFSRSNKTYSAVNGDGFMVDLIKPEPTNIMSNERRRIGDAENDLDAAEIEGLIWLKNAPRFDAMVLDEQGAPSAMVTVDPRAFAAHKFWLSSRTNRDPIKKRRDRLQAEAVADLTTRYFPHLPYVAADLRMLPLDVYEAAKPLFT